MTEEKICQKHGIHMRRFGPYRKKGYACTYYNFVCYACTVRAKTADPHRYKVHLEANKRWRKKKMQDDMYMERRRFTNAIYNRKRRLGAKYTTYAIIKWFRKASTAQKIAVSMKWQ